MEKRGDDMKIQKSSVETEEIYDKLNIKTVCEKLAENIEGMTKIVQVLGILLDGLVEQKMKSKYIKCVQSECGTLISKFSDLTKKSAQLKNNVSRITDLIDRDAKYYLALKMTEDARYRFFERDEMASIENCRKVLQDEKASDETKETACLDVFYTVIVHGFNKPFFMPHMHAQNMINQSYVFRFDEEPRYSILRRFAGYNEQASLLAGDYCSNVGRLAEAARIYKSYSRSPIVMIDIGLFLRKNRNSLKMGVVTENDVIEAYYEVKTSIERKIGKIIDSDPKFSFLNDIKSDHDDLALAFRILYVYAIKENNDLAANGASAMIIRKDISLPDDKKDEIKNEMESIAKSKANLVYLNGITTGLVNDLCVKKNKKLPGREGPGEEISYAEYIELKQNLSYLSSIFPTARYNCCRLRYVESIGSDKKEDEYDYVSEIRELEEIIEMIPKDNNYYGYAKEFCKERSIEYHRRELEKLENNN
ncbi:MAG: hypothetical protein J5585_01555 [Clostridia bacterium]|nr:hypothetical protein [Clostridia bacterium]